MDIGTWIIVAANIILAGGTIVSLFLTRRQLGMSINQLREAQQVAHVTQQQAIEAQHSLFRPMLVPKGPLMLKEVSYGIKRPDWSNESFELLFSNVGSGVATNIQIRLFGPIEEIGIEANASRYSFEVPAPLSPNEGVVTCNPEKSTGPFSSEYKIGDHGLAAPEGMAARLILTYHDIFNRKLASIFDYTHVGIWRSVDFPEIKKDLADLDKEIVEEQVRAYRAMRAANIQRTIQAPLP